MPDQLPGERLYSFPGGLELRHHKQIACRRPVQRPPLPERLYIPLGQHQGESGRLCVTEGERVDKGQALSASGDDFIVPVHAPTSGRIGALVNHPAAFPPGGTRRSLVLEPDGEDRWGECRRLDQWSGSGRDGEAIIDHLHAHGLAGLGGAMFPTAAKLRGDWNDIHTLILNGAECEPWIACDEMLMRERPEAIVEGGLIMARAVRARRVVIAIEDRMNAVRERLETARRDIDPEGIVRIIQVLTIYPEGGERQLIQTLTGHEVPHDGLPQDLGVVCHNVATAAAARDAVIEGQPLIERIVTVTGPGIAEPCNLRALIGTPFSRLIEAAGGYQGEVTRLVLGGPLSGTALASDEIAVTKGANCLLALTRDEVEATQPTMPCINCGECVRVCPARLLPQTLFRHLEARQYDKAAELDLADCIECGCCAQVCPSHIPLVDYYRHGKDELARRRLDQRRAELARRRYEAREKRLQREQQQRRARRKEREEKLKQPEKARDEIQAAIERARQKKGPENE